MLSMKKNIIIIIIIISLLGNTNSTISKY